MALEVFCCYAYEDEGWLRKLEIHLSSLKRQGLLSLWHDRLISPGTNRQQVIDTHLETASVILLLVSADFLASDYCYGIEMKRALERHQAGEVRIIPILVRQVDWKHTPFAHLQVLPTDAKPITMWQDEDMALANVAMGLRRVIEEVPILAANAPHATPLVVWNVPHVRNPHFTGRDELLDQLHEQLTPAGQDASAKTRRAALTQPQAIKGLGGIGKTQIAVEYAYRCRDLNCYTHTLWINAANEEVLITSFVTIAELLPSFPAKNETDQSKRIEAIKHWLEECEQRWLLIFDNADDISLVRGFLPQGGRGSILLTTRASAVSSIGASIEVEKMGFIEGTHLLLRRAQRFEQASDEDVNEAGNIVIALDHFPLALDQAGAYIEETGCGLVDYLQVYQTHRKELLVRRGLQATNYPDSVATTWSLSLQKVEQANPAAAELLRLCAFLAPDKIPEELVRNGAAQWSPLLQQAAIDPFAFNQMMAELLKFSLVQRLAGTRTLSIHRLVQAVQVDRMEPEIQRQWVERVVRAVNDVFPNDPQDIASWTQCLRYLDQAQKCNTLIEQYMLPLIEAADLLNRTGLYLDEHASYTMAEPLYQRALAIREEQLGGQHLDTATILTNLAGLYRKQAKYKEAEPLYQRALAIREEQLGGQHLDTATTLANLASVFRDQGKHKEAEPLYQRALAIREGQAVEQHSDTAKILSDLGSLYRNQNKYKEAEPLYQRALSIYEQQLGPEHLHTARCLNDLAALYRDQGKYEVVEPLFQRALSIYKQRLGPDHPKMATGFINLASLYQKQGKYKEAELLFQRALSIREQQLGSENLDTAHSLNKLASFYQNQGKYELAEPLYRRALSIREQQLGPETPDTATSLNNLASLHQKQGKYAKAEPLYQRALTIYEQQLGPEHPNTASCLNNLAMLYYTQGKYAEAEPLYQRALSIRERVLGLGHPETQTVRENYTSLLQTMGRDAEIKKLG